MEDDQFEMAYDGPMENFSDLNGTYQMRKEPTNTGRPIYFGDHDGITAMQRVSQILSNSCIVTQVAELTAFINQTPIDELSGCFSTIVESVFGFNTQNKWNLKGMTASNSPVIGPRVMNFLGAEGPIIELTYRLMADPDLVFEFPITCLPMALERRIRRNEIPPYIASKLQRTDLINISFESPKLLLNAFEFYFFHYAFVELGSPIDLAQQYHMSGWASMSETVYSNLLDEYLRFFFPCSGTGLPDIQNVSRPIDNRTTFMLPTQTRRSVPALDLIEPRPKLFKASMYHDESLFRDTGIHPGIPTRQKEIWRTETVLNIFVTMWLSIDNDPAEQQFETLLPSVDLVKSVRIMARHLHYFVNCVSVRVNHPLEEILRNGWTMFQKKIYLLLRYLFTSWPLDNSFRIVYETWLSFIQPWRYINYGIQMPTTGSESEEVVLEGRFQTFIMENILAYTYLFQRVVPRILRTELNSLRNAHMLYRIAKVFMGIDALKRTLVDIERNLVCEPSSSSSRLSSPIQSSNTLLNNTGHYVSPSDFVIPPVNSSPLSPTGQITQNTSEILLKRTVSTSRHPVEFANSGLKLASVRQLMIELEGPNFNYVPLFSDASKEKIAVIVTAISEALSSLKNNPLEPVIPLTKLQSWSSWLLGLEKDTVALRAQQKVLEHERTRIIFFLESSRTYIEKLVDLPRTEGPILSEEEFEQSLGLGNTLEMSETATDSRNRRSSSPIDPNTLWKASAVLRRGQFIPELLQRKGNPDLEPPRRHEVRFFVSILFKLSLFLNKWIVPWAQTVYFQDGMKGRLCRAVLARPVYYVDLQRDNDPAKAGKKNTVKKYLPPRVNFRPIGTQNLPVQVLGIAILLAFIGVRGSGWAVAPILLFLVYVLVKAGTEPRNHAAALRDEFHETLSGNLGQAYFVTPTPIAPRRRVNATSPK